MTDQKFIGAVIGSLCLFGTAVNAHLIYEQNFETLSLGTINGQDGWFGSTNDVVQNTVALGTQALYVGDWNTVIRPTVFSPFVREQLLEFDFRLPAVITDFGPSTDILTTVVLRGPVPFRESVFAYRGIKDGSGNVLANRFEIRTSSPLIISQSPNTVQKDTWYRVSLLYDWNLFTVNPIITTNGGVFWDPSSQTLMNGSDGNPNAIRLNADLAPMVGFYFDNFIITPEPSTALLLGLGGWLLWRRSRR